MLVVALSTTNHTQTSTPTLIAAGPLSQLPLNLHTGNATQVITVVATAADAATAQLQAWEKANNNSGSWQRVGPVITAHVASGGLTRMPREDLSATPEGSYTLTQAFGKLPNPGTSMPFVQVTAADWWISQPGPLYNTHQVCTAACPFTTGNPNT